MAPSFAADPLLSGYSGPGGGEQVVIGSKVLPAKNGNGSIRSGATSSSAATQPSNQGTSDSSKKDAGSSGESAPAQETPAAQTPAAAEMPTYPNEVSSASSLPLSRGDLILIAAAGLVALLVGFGAKRLTEAGA